MLQEQHDERNLETIPVGALGIISMKGVENGLVIDAYLKRWRETKIKEKIRERKNKSGYYGFSNHINF